MSFYIKRDPWHDMMEQLGEPRAKTLPGRFNGQGKKEGYSYWRWLTAPDCYFYEVTKIDTREVHYEIFGRKIVGKRKDKRELYPWEEPVCDLIETFNNSSAANYRFAEIMRSY